MAAPVRLSRRLQSQAVSGGIEIIQSSPFDETTEQARIMVTRESAQRLLPILEKLISGKTKRKGPPVQD